MEEDILTSIKKLLGIPEEYDVFDMDLTMHINTVFMILNQLGVGPSAGFSISYDDETPWSDYLSENDNLEAVKSYMHLKVKLLFDHTLSSSVVDSITKVTNELEWRLNVAVDPGSDTEEE